MLHGESNTGKTELTSKFLSFIQNSSDIKEIYVFDFGPQRFQIKDSSIGGKLSDYNKSFENHSKIEVFSYNVRPPRSSSENQMEVYKNCAENYHLISNQFNTVIDILSNNPDGNSAVIINDFSIFLHLGNPIPFLKILNTSHTVFLNSYFGTKLAEDYGSNISWREKMLVELLSRRFDYSIYLIK